MGSYDDDFDRFLYEQIKRGVEEIPVPDIEGAWAELEEKLNIQMRKKRRMLALKKIVAAVVVVMLIFTGIFIVTDDNVYADSKIFKTIKSLWVNVTSIAGFTQNAIDPQEEIVEETNKAGEKTLYMRDKCCRLNPTVFRNLSYLP